MVEKLMAGALAVAVGALMIPFCRAHSAAGEAAVAEHQRRAAIARQSTPASVETSTSWFRPRRRDVRAVQVPPSALTMVEGQSTTCAVTFVDGTTQIAVITLAQ